MKNGLPPVRARMRGGESVERAVLAEQVAEQLGDRLRAERL